VLLIFSIYVSFLYFGHQPVPNSDWSAFLQVGHELVSFHLPSDYKRTPVLGILHVLLGHIMPGDYPELTAGWVLNAVLYPVNVLLIWLISRRIIGKAAVWFTLIAAVNPFVLDMLRNPIVEMTLLCSFLTTLYLIMRRSRWSYLLAAVSSMLRYEGALLIFAAFVVDMLTYKEKRQRLYSLLYACLASIPLGLWMLGTVLNWQHEGSFHYLKDIGGDSGGKIVLGEYVSFVWQTTFAPLFLPSPSMQQDTAQTLLALNKFFAGAAFIFGAIYGLCKKRWEILAFLILLVPYILIHAIHSVILGRYCMPVGWMVLLVAWYGLTSCMKLISGNSRIPQPIIYFLQAFILLMAVLWLVTSVQDLPSLTPYSVRSVSLPYVASAAALVIAGLTIIWQKNRFILRTLAVLSVIILMLVSNQFMVAQVIGNGQEDIEFKYLAEWYLKNASPGEKLASSMSGLVATFAPKYKNNCVHLGGIAADSPQEFIEQCHKLNITYVTWDSRLGNCPSDR
jgi:hypothetical protein